MRMRRSIREMDMTSGSILPNMIRFAIPLMLSSILQLLFNAADVVVVGKFEGSNALAAVGSTGALVNLIVNVFLGLSVGTNVIVARHYGAGAFRDASETVHTSVAVSLLGGVVLAVFGYFMAGTFLSWMGSPEEVLPLATVYVQIYFLGMPFNMLYNFGSSVLRAVGETKRPMIYLTIAGVINVCLNMIFVIVFHMGVAGVALATIISQAFSASMVFLCLLRSDGVVRVEWAKLRIKADKLKDISRIGIPAGMQGVCFSLSNVLIQSTINSFGATAVAGNSVASNLEGFSYVAMNAFHQAAITFTSQNVGAGKNKRVRRVAVLSNVVVSVVGVIVGGVFLILGNQLMGIYTDVPAVIEAGWAKLGIIGTTHFICGILDVLSGILRGLGCTIGPMIISLIGTCAMRILWIYLILPLNRTLFMLYLSYPISWILTVAAYVVYLLRVLRRYPVHHEQPEEAAMVRPS